jgi:hypothetical protein
MSQPDHSPAECSDFTVFLVSGVNLESCMPIKAFTVRTAAEYFAMECSGYDLGQPEFPEDDDEESRANYCEALRDWAHAHPAGSSTYDHYSIGPLLIVNCPPF